MKKYVLEGLVELTNKLLKDTNDKYEKKLII